MRISFFWERISLARQRRLPCHRRNEGRNSTNTPAGHIFHF